MKTSPALGANLFYRRYYSLELYHTITPCDYCILETMMFRTTLALSLQLLVFAAVGAFCPPTAPWILSQVQARHRSAISNNMSATKSSAARTYLSAKNNPSDDEKERRKITSTSELILLFLTPWKNPNSIFLYMFLILIILGKINENKPI